MSKPKNNPGQARKEEVHKRNEERKAERDRNPVLVYTDDEGAETPVLLSKLYVMVYPADGTEDAAFPVVHASLTERKGDASAEDIG